MQTDEKKLRYFLRIPASGDPAVYCGTDPAEVGAAVARAIESVVSDPLVGDGLHEEFVLEAQLMSDAEVAALPEV